MNNLENSRTKEQYTPEEISEYITGLLLYKDTGLYSEIEVKELLNRVWSSIECEEDGIYPVTHEKRNKSQTFTIY